jgi:hypothetical protein
MADYELVPGDNVTISVDIGVDDFIYRGGLFRIVPTASFIVGGDYIFAPTSSEDPPGDIFRCLLTRFIIDTGRNGTLAGFHTYDSYERNKSLFFPCIIVDNFENADEPETYFFGGDYMNKAMIGIDLAFKRDKYVTIDGERVGQRELAEFYLHDVRKKINDIAFESDVVCVGNLAFDSTIEEPKERNETLYGFSMDVTIEYKVED